MKTLSQLAGSIGAERRESVPQSVWELVASSDLPTVVEGMFYTDEDSILSSIDVDGEPFVVLGRNEESFAGVYAVTTAGGVVHLDDESDDPHHRFVNSSAQLFLHFLAEWNGFITGPGGVDDEDAIIEAGMRLRKRLRKVDKAAFVDEESWWSRVFEDVEYGLIGPD